MGAPAKNELRLLRQYAAKCRFIIETGGGVSTDHLARVARKTGARFVSIEANPDRIRVIEGAEQILGWSVTFDDIIKPEHPKFIESRYKTIDRAAAHGDESVMQGETDLIRKVLDESDVELDFFFCDTGEYCGIAEWRIVRSRLAVGGYYAMHDTLHPKSIKNFQVLKEMKKDPLWKVIVQTKGRQGLAIGQKVG
jgi:hypothetical protein